MECFTNNYREVSHYFQLVPDLSQVLDRTLSVLPTRFYPVVGWGKGSKEDNKARSSEFTA